MASPHKGDAPPHASAGVAHIARASATVNAAQSGNNSRLAAISRSDIRGRRRLVRLLFLDVPIRSLLRVKYKYAFDIEASAHNMLRVFMEQCRARQPARPV